MKKGFYILLAVLVCVHGLVAGQPRDRYEADELYLKGYAAGRAEAKSETEVSRTGAIVGVVVTLLLITICCVAGGVGNVSKAEGNRKGG